MSKSLDEIIDDGLAYVLPLFKEHPEMVRFLREMSMAVCADCGSITPEMQQFPLLLAEKGTALFGANFSAVLGQVENLDPEFKVVCAAGCSYCCSSHITLSPQEAFRIALHLAADRPEDEFIRLTEECLSAASEFVPGQLKVFAQSYFQPCPFLKDNRCSIYEVRPILCRNWISTDLEACRKSFNTQNKVTVPQNALIMVQKDLIFTGQQAYLAGFGIEGGIGSFMPMLAQILTDYEGSYAKWLGGEKLNGQL
ncbi:YkgJ family cysteine cluster protein [Maridesulfovibrio sp.]|uniref:YkgJ family cysteine cluster protein n=1 Tax=Maridesulfovibrio sp. TaxID=2795000 RepID=UPI002AA6C31F|nr:YkgJ family cysteine cluster protein [Maridesulfovibrio sp.]